MAMCTLFQDILYYCYTAHFKYITWLGVGVRADERRVRVGGVAAHATEGEGRELAGRQLELRPLLTPRGHGVAPPH